MSQQRSRETLVHRIERGAFAALMALSPQVQRVLAGRPVVIDGQTLAPDVQLTLRLAVLGRKPGPETLPIDLARTALIDQGVLSGGRHQVGAVRELEAAGLPARLYVPTGAPPAVPLLVFFHGGGFFLGDLDTHDASCRFLAERSGVRVLSVDYRLAPEHRFPAAYDDAVAAYAWAHEHATELGADPSRIGVGGDSAGGNLAAGVAHAAARSGLACAASVLLYPALDRLTESRSEKLFGRGFYLTDNFLTRASDSYAGSPDDPHDPRFSPGRDDVPAGLAPTWVFTAGFDPLRDEGEAYVGRLREAGVDVRLTRFPDQIHGFLNMLVAPTAVAANVEVALALSSALSAGA